MGYGFHFTWIQLCLEISVCHLVNVCVFGWVGDTKYTRQARNIYYDIILFFSVSAWEGGWTTRLPALRKSWSIDNNKTVHGSTQTRPPALILLITCTSDSVWTVWGQLIKNTFLGPSVKRKICVIVSRTAFLGYIMAQSAPDVQILLPHIADNLMITSADCCCYQRAEKGPSLLLHHLKKNAR